MLATHIDNILVFSKYKDLINNLYINLTKLSRLEVSNLGKIKEFLGVAIIRNRSTRSIIITQESFIRKLLTKFNKLNNKPKNISLPIGLKLEKNKEI